MNTVPYQEKYKIKNLQYSSSINNLSFQLMETLNLQIQTDMAYQWLTANGVDFQGSCNLVHSGSCFVEFWRVFRDVGKVGWKYYISFHLIPLLLRLRKCQDVQEVLKLFKKTGVEYAKSVLFMMLLVSGMKIGLCTTTQNRLPFLTQGIIGSGFLSAISILFEERSRRRQIGYFVMAKALHSSYKIVKRTNSINFNNELVVMHVSLMSLLYYVYSYHPGLLKFLNIFQKVFGD